MAPPEPLPPSPVPPGPEPAAVPQRLRLATVWLAGCSGCHMSLLDLDEWLFELAAWADVVFSPVASDRKRFPEAVDVCLVEGAVANSDNLALALELRQRSRVVVSFGDCAISGNVPALRNLLSGPEAVLERGYLELADGSARLPRAPGVVPELLPQVLPLHAVIDVDLFLPGCPPSPSRIRACLEPLLHGAWPHLSGPEGLRFG
ncbi:MAG: oxidoreductase [Synechococcaceae cyanobacterium]|nr:oxidoreductase [Synechococcaceae cyanobacterium]